MPAALVVVTAGAVPVAEAEPVLEPLPLPTAAAANVPVGKLNPVTLPEKGPGATDACAPMPERAGVGGLGVVLFAMAAALNASKVLLPVVGALMDLIQI